MVALVGATASGKSALALAAAAARSDVEIVSADSMVVYREMDVATAKPTPAERAMVPHHLIDLVAPCEEFTVADYQEAAHQALAQIAAREHRALLVGGTGLYVRALVDGLAMPGRFPEVAARLTEEASAPGGLARLYAHLAQLDPLGAARTTPTNARRIIRALEVTLGAGRPFSSFGPGLEAYPPVPTVLLGLPLDRPAVDRRIAQRFRTWMDQGLLDEVRRLASRPGGLSRTARQALGYRELLAHLEDGADLEDCVATALQRTRALARRQWAWFRRDPRIRWLGPHEDPLVVLGQALESAKEHLRAPLAGRMRG